MPVSKLKNLILLILALATAFLLALVVPLRLSQTHSEQRLHEQLEQLFAASGIQLTTQHLPQSRQLCVIEAGGIQTAASTAATALLGQTVLLEEDSTRYTLHYTSAAGICSFSPDGSFSAALTGVTASGAPLSHAKDLLRRMGYEAASIEARPRADGGTDIVSTQSVLDVPVLSGTLTLSYDASGALTALTGSFFPADELLRVGDSVSCSCADALVALLSRRDTLGWVGSSVTVMTQGFRRADSASAAARLTPVWRIDTDAGSFYVSGVTREVTPAGD